MKGKIKAILQPFFPPKSCQFRVYSARFVEPQPQSLLSFVSTSHKSHATGRTFIFSHTHKAKTTGRRAALVFQANNRVSSPLRPTLIRRLPLQENARRISPLIVTQRRSPSSSEHICSLVTHTHTCCLFSERGPKTCFKKQRKHEYFIATLSPSTRRQPGACSKRSGTGAPRPVHHVTFSLL